MAYPQGNQGGYGGQVDHPQGMTILILGILGIVCCAICAPFAWVMGNRAKAEIDANPGRYKNESYVTIGRILGMVGTILAVIGIIGYAIFGIALASSN
jgi:sulfite exporter TauE/SafE